MKEIDFPIKHEKVDDTEEGKVAEDTQLGDSSRMESPPSMEVEELLTLSFHGYRTEEKTGPNAKALANVEEGKAFVEGKTCCHWMLQG